MHFLTTYLLPVTVPRMMHWRQFVEQRTTPDEFLKGAGLTALSDCWNCSCDQSGIAVTFMVEPSFAG